MKKGFLLLALLNLILFLHPSVSAQRLSAKNDINLVESSVKYTGAEAVSDGRGVLIEWETVNESENLGFYIYRIDSNQKVLVNSSLIPGAHLQMREGQTFGKKYTFFDTEGDLSSTYYIESLNLNGQTQVSNQFSSKFISDFSSPAGKLFEAGRKSFSTANPNVLKNEVSLPKTLQAEVEGNKLQADSDKQRWVAAQPGVKIGVKKEGIYRVTKAELQTAGFDITASTTFWQLYRDGVEQSIIVGNNGDYIEFYGKGIDTRESDTQIYFLVVGTENGKRINSTFRRAIGSPVLQDSYAQSFIFKERTSHFIELFNGEAENFFGRLLNNTSVNIPLNLTAVDFNVAVSSIDITVQGLSQGAHQTKVILNGVELGVITGSGKNSMSRRFEIQTSILQEGANNLQLTTLNGIGDTSVFDTVKVNYARQLQAVQNSLSFYTKNYKASYIGGFTSPNIRVFDISYPDSPSIVANPQIKQNGSNYQVYLPPYRGRVMYAVEDSAVLQAASFVRNDPSSLSNVAHNADLVIISYKDWMTEANNWADYRRTQSLKVEVVNIDDVYDEFSFGVFSSDSIESFLQFAKNNWQTPPNYVLLLGDATYDTRNYTGDGSFNYIPTKMVETVYMETGSDEALADFNNDGLAEISIGRITAHAGEDVTVSLNKTKNFEQTVAQGLSRGVLFASDLPNGYNFEAMSMRLANKLPANTPKVMINRALPDAHNQLINQMNSGKFLVNFSGHGSTEVWADKTFFQNLDARQLTNGNNLSIFTMLTCLNGYFIQIKDSLSEALLKNENGGAVAVWASTGKTTPDVQEIMATRFYSQIAAGNMTRIGDLIKDAKTTINGGRDVRLSWALIGDPTLKVK